MSKGKKGKHNQLRPILVAVAVVVAADAAGDDDDDCAGDRCCATLG